MEEMRTAVFFERDDASVVAPELLLAEAAQVLHKERRPMASGGERRRSWA